MTIRTMISAAFVCSLVASTFACAVPTEENDAPSVAPVEATSHVEPQMIKQGGCTPEQLEWGWFEAGGDCYGPSTGGGGGAACAACETKFDKCSKPCDAKTGTAAKTCLNACVRVLSLCYSHC